MHPHHTPALLWSLLEAYRWNPSFLLPTHPSIQPQEGFQGVSILLAKTPDTAPSSRLKLLPTHDLNRRAVDPG